MIASGEAAQAMAKKKSAKIPGSACRPGWEEVDEKTRRPTKAFSQQAAGESHKRSWDPAERTDSKLRQRYVVGGRRGNGISSL